MSNVVYRYGYRWVSYKPKLPYKDYPKESGIYIIRIKDDTKKKFTTVYVGCTNNLQKRIPGHLVIKCIFSNLYKRNATYSIDVLFCSFGDLKKYKFTNLEKNLIRKLNPMFNSENTCCKARRNFKRNHTSINKFNFLKFHHF